MAQKKGCLTDLRFNNLFPYPGISHGRPLARRERPDGAVGSGWVAWRHSMVSQLRPGELRVRHVESYRRLGTT